MQSIQNTGRKVVLGFFLTTVFLIAIAGLTHIALNRLEKSVLLLAKPSQKLEVLTTFQAEVFKIISGENDSIGSDIRVKDTQIVGLEAKLSLLDSLAADSLEKAKIQSIRENLALLIVGYLDLYEVKNNLANRTFSQEALRRVEIGIRRRATAVESEPLRELDPKKFIFETPQSNSVITQNGEKQGIVIQDRDRLTEYFQNLQKQSSRPTQNTSQSLDSILFNLKGVIQNIYQEESAQRRRLARIESDISQKQREVGNSIQTLVADLQTQTFRESSSQSQEASSLVNDVSFFLVIVVILTILGALGLVFSILREIRLNKKYQENLEDSKQKSEFLARSKQEFLANMSHEIRNPLHVIQGYRSVLERSDLTPDQKSHLGRIGFASDTLLEIVDDILDFSKLEAGKLKLENHPFDPMALFASVRNFFELDATEKKLDFKWELNLPENLWLLGDALRFKQILNNLLSNAFKFTNQGGIQVKVDWDAGKLALEVKDSGIGMSPEELGKIFQEFSQADASISRKYGGTGLGLVIVQRLVQLMDGEVKIQSEKGKGTSISVMVPLETCLPEEDLTEEIQADAVDLNGLKILVIDDDRAGLKYLETILAFFGAETISYSGGVDFRDRYDSVFFDLAFVDIQMPEFSGFDVVQKIRQLQLDFRSPIIAMTANVFVEEKEKLLEAGFDELILKPFVEKKLVALLGKLLPDRVRLVTVETATSQPAEEKPLDLSDMERFCMGDRDLLEDILKDVLIQTELDLERLTKARLNNRWGEIMGICHQLSSRLGQLKSPAGKKAQHIENMLKLNVQKGLPKHLVELDEEVRKTLKALNELLKEKV